MSKDENGTEISRTEPHRFLYLIRSNPYFLVRLYRFRFRISDVSYFKCKSRKRFRHFSTVFYFSTFNLIPNSKFGLNRIWPTAQVIQPNYRLLTTQLRSFNLWLAALSYRRRPASSILLCIWSCTCLMLCTVGRYFVLNFRIPTVFNIIPLELVCF